MRYFFGTFLVVVLLFVPMCIVLRIQTIPFVPSLIHSQIDLLRNHRMTLNAQILEYDVTLVQDPSDAFYMTYLVMKRDGQEGLAYLMIDIDDSKIRRPQIIAKEGVIYFCDGPNTSSPVASVDTNTMTVSAGLTGQRLLSDIDFDDGWVYGGGSPIHCYKP